MPSDIGISSTALTQQLTPTKLMKSLFEGYKA